jgi:hypothetical protein
LIGREHHAEGRDDGVEGSVGERQCLGIGLLEFDGQTFGRRPGATALQQARHIIRGSDVAPAPRGGEARHPVTGGHVEHFPPGPQIESFAELFADDLQGGADDGIVTRRPGSLLPGLHGREVGYCGGRTRIDRLGSG